MSTTEAQNIASDQDAAAEAGQEVAKAMLPAARKPTAKQKAAAAKAAGQTKAQPTMREYVLDGETFKVSINLTETQAHAAAVKLRDAQLARAAKDSKAGEPTHEVERVAETAKPKAPRGRVIPAGSLKVRLSKTAFESAVAGTDGAAWRKEHAKAWKSMKDTKASRFGSTITYYVVITTDDAESLRIHLLATAKAWEKAGSKSKLGNPKPLVRNAGLIEADLKAWRKGQ